MLGAEKKIVSKKLATNCPAISWNVLWCQTLVLSATTELVTNVKEKNFLSIDLMANEVCMSITL